jgi:transcriptional regulator with XRE-family HTH domain
MADGGSPLVQRRLLRAELKKARQESGLTQEQVATEMEWSPSKVIRIESGSSDISAWDLKALLKLYGVKVPEEVDLLVALARAERMSTAVKFGQKSRKSQDVDVPTPFEACDPSGTFVFVGYAHRDKAVAYPELLRIRSLGIKVWYDEGIEPMREWSEAVASALTNSAAFVALITPTAVDSMNVRNEISFAQSLNKPFLAIHLTQTKLPLGLQLQIGAVQAIKRWQMDEDSYQRKLAKALARYAERENKA